jgi:uncharacterized protein (DUF111 family)
MKTLYYDCFCGISGDMNLGAMVDLGVNPEYLKSELAKLPMASEFEVIIQKAVKKGIEGTKVDVRLTGEAPVKHHEHAHPKHDHHAHTHENEAHKHSHDHAAHAHTHENAAHAHTHENAAHAHTHDHPTIHTHTHEKALHVHNNAPHALHEHRNLAIIDSMISGSTLSESVKALSLKIFMEVAKAEAKVHGKPLQEVHFHEVGAVDSIVDIVGAAICFEALGVERVVSSSVQLGGGFVKCDHGMMPVPAPATAEILKGVPVRIGLVASEMTTPTGAAILKALVNEYSDQMSMNIAKIGYGLGTREHEFPNVLRVMILEEADDSNATSQSDTTMQKKNS